MSARKEIGRLKHLIFAPGLPQGFDPRGVRLTSETRSLVNHKAKPGAPARHVDPEHELRSSRSAA